MIRRQKNPASVCKATVCGDLGTTTVMPAKAGIQGWMGGLPSYQFAHLLIYPDLRNEVGMGYAKVLCASEF